MKRLVMIIRKIVFSIRVKVTERIAAFLSGFFSPSLLISNFLKGIWVKFLKIIHKPKHLSPEIDPRLSSVNIASAPKEFDEHQASAWASPYKKNLVIAGAGAGKTEVIVQRTKLLSGLGVSPERILMVTFTQKATGEMNKRLEGVFGKKFGSKKFPNVSTIHQLSRSCYKRINPIVSQTYKKEVNQPIYKAWKQVFNSWVKKEPSFSSRIYEWQRASRIKKDNANIEYIYKTAAAGYDKPSLQTKSGVLVRSKAEQIIADFLFDNQIRFEYEKPVLFCDWPFRPDFYLLDYGCYIEYLGLWNAPNNDVRHEYQMACENKKKQFEKAGWEKWANIDLFESDLTKGTYKEKILDKVAYLKKLDKRKKHYLKLETADKRIRDEIKSNDRKLIEFLMSIDDCLKVNRVGIESLGSFMPYVFHPLIDLTLEMSKQVSSLLVEEGLLESNEMLAQLAHKFSEDEAFLDGIAAQYDYLFMDEFQDTTPVLFHFLRPLMNKIPFFAIGDDRQAIYGFNGGTPYFIRNMEEYFPGVARKSLIYNYRSNQTIVETSLLFTDPKATRSVAKDTTIGKITLFVVENEVEQVGQVLEEVGKRLGDSRLMILSRVGADVNEVVKQYESLASEAELLTMHGSKGLQREGVLVVGVVEGQGAIHTVPAQDWDHPAIRYIKSKSLQDSIAKEEERLFYVALSRAQKHLFVVTQKGNESSYVKRIIQKQKDHELVLLKRPVKEAEAVLNKG